MTHLNRYISYYKDCYEADNRGFVFDNFFSTRYQSQYVFKGAEQLANGDELLLEIPAKNGKKIAQNLELYKNDTEFLYALFFVVGKRKIFGQKTSKITAPLFFCYADLIEEDDFYFIKLKLGLNIKINTGFLKTLVYKTSFESFYDNLEKLITAQPQINHNFYGDGLRIMTETPKNQNQHALSLCKMEGIYKNGENPIEANAIISRIKKTVHTEKDLSSEYSSTIGVLSPFRNQVKYIEKQIKERFTLKEIRKHALRLGTPCHFQGDEKDIMLLSFAVDDKAHASSFNYLEKPDVFNVSVTRARNEQWIYYSVNSGKLKSESLLRNYLEQESIEFKESVNNYDKFAEEVISEINTNFPESKTYLGYSIAELSIDILLEINQKYLAIDLIGYPGEFVDGFSMERYKIMSRAGIETFPLSYVSWKYDSEKIKKAIVMRINKLTNNKEILKAILLFDYYSFPLNRYLGF